MIRNGYTEPNILVEEDTSLSSKRTRIALAALLVMQVEVAYVGGFGLLIGFIYFAYTFQRGKAIARFEKRFGK